VWQRHIEDCATPQVAVLGAKYPLGAQAIEALIRMLAIKKGGHLARLLYRQHYLQHIKSQAAR
jgi:hypothetical protein